MKLTIEPTDQIQPVNGQPCRVWKGEDERGTPVHVYVSALSPQTLDEDRLASFDRELKALLVGWEASPEEIPGSHQVN